MISKLKSTKNISGALGVMEEVESPQRGGRYGIGVIYGDYSTGKSAFIEEYASELLYPLIDCTRFMSYPSFLKTILGELKVESKGRSISSDTWDKICNKLLDSPTTLIFDEAGYLLQQGGALIEVIKNINTYTNCPIVLVGKESFRRKLGSYPDVVDRITAEFKFSKLTQPEVSDLLKELCDIPVTSKAASAVFLFSEGKFRQLIRMITAIEKIAKTADMEEVTVETVQFIATKMRTKR